MAKKVGKSFEESMKRLEEIVERLEEADVSLEETLNLFEEGKKLSEECQGKLLSVEKRVAKVMEDSEGEISLEDFEEKE